MKSVVIAATLTSSVAFAASCPGRAIIQLDSTTGPAKQLGSAWLYGLPNNGTSASNQIPDHFYTDVAFRGTRAGGSQLTDGGWATGGKPTYDLRFNSTLSTYRTARKFNADFTLIMSDLWGADGGQDGSHYPGDNGNWTETNLFLAQLVSDMRANNLIEGVFMDIYNEPDHRLFWTRTWDQYLQVWNHCYRYIREHLPEVKIVGPSAAYCPDTISDKSVKWHAWSASVAGNGTIPDVYTWHHIGDDKKEPDWVTGQWAQYRAQYGLPERPIEVNEYAWVWRQNPANSAWYLAQFERNDMKSMRANWGSKSDLHDHLADLLMRYENGTYAPNGEWWLFKYYAEMRGQRAVTKGSGDIDFDAFATVDTNVVKILAGTRTYEFVWDVSDYLLEVRGVDSALKLAPDATVDVRTWRFDHEGPEVEVGPPVDLGTKPYQLKNGTLRMRYSAATNETAYAFEIAY